MRGREVPASAPAQGEGLMFLALRVPNLEAKRLLNEELHSQCFVLI